MSRMSMDLHTRNVQNIKQIQRLMMSPQMQQAIHLLQMPVQELSNVIETELQQNPVLENEESNPEENAELESLEIEHTEEPENQEIGPERELLFDERDFEIIQRLDSEFKDYLSDSANYSAPDPQEQEKLHTFLENSVQISESLFEHLMQQARETFSSKQLSMAEAIIGNLDASGFLHTPLSEIGALYHCHTEELSQMLKEIQQFDPIGVGATSLQESLLIQLEACGKKNSLAYKIISAHYQDLLHNYIPIIQKSLRTSAEEINLAINQDISRLDLHPGANYSREKAAPIIPDVALVEEDERLIVAVNNDQLPPLRINQRYMQMLYDENLCKETKDFIKNKIMSARWLLHNIFQRNDTIERIAESLAKRQKDFFLNPNGTLTPLTMKTLADELSVHESTIARAVANKYLSSPRGIFPLRFFFSNAYVSEKGDDISAKTVKNILKELIDTEDKAKPISDQQLSKEIQTRGIPCARRTIAKYRAELNIGNAQQRRKFR